MYVSVYGEFVCVNVCIYESVLNVCGGQRTILGVVPQVAFALVLKIESPVGLGSMD